MPIPCSCPACGAKFTAPDIAAGKKAKCKSCGGGIVVPAASEPEPARDVLSPAPAPSAIAVLPPPAPVLLPPLPTPVPVPTADYAPQPVRTQQQYAACAFCGEDVLPQAKKCKHCGETLDLALRAAEEAKREARDARRSNSRPVSVRQSTQVNVHMKAPFNHVIHLILDVLTCGAWIPVHLICWAAR